MKAVHRSNFSVSFLDVNDAPTHFLKQLEELVLAVDLGTELLSQPELAHRTNTLIVWIADDWASTALAAIRKHVKDANPTFKVLVKIHDGSLLKEIFVYNDCMLSALQHSIFTREEQDERIMLIDGTSHSVIKPPTAREASAKLLQIAFTSFEHHIIGSIQ